MWFKWVVLYFTLKTFLGKAVSRTIKSSFRRIKRYNNTFLSIRVNWISSNFSCMYIKIIGT